MKVCKVEGCERELKAKGCCQRHYWQIRTYGKTIGNPKRSYRDPNEFIIEGDICRIKLCDIFGNLRAEAIINAEDYEKVKDRKWHLTDHGYVKHWHGADRESLHKIILGEAPGNKEPDHKDRNKLNNRKSNLRWATRSQNLCNSQRRNASGFKGVYWQKSHNKWAARIRLNGKFTILGYFISKIDAARTFNEAAIKYHGDFARLNEGV